MSEKRAIGLRVLITGASLVVVVAGLRAAGPIVIPVLFAAFLTILAIPPVQALQRRGFPDWLAVAIIVSGVLAGATLITLLVGNSLADFSQNVDSYGDQLEAIISNWLSLLDEYGLSFIEGTELRTGTEGELEVSELSSGAGEGAEGAEGGDESIMHPGTGALIDLIDPRMIANLAGSVVSSIGNALSNTIFVLFTTAFIMAEAAGLPRKLQLALGSTTEDVERFSRVIDDIQEYLSIKTWISGLTGLLAWGLCLAVGVDYPVLWGLVAFFLNYIPTLGSIIAAVPPTLLALVQFGWERSLILVVGYVAINLVVGSILEPRIMGKRLGLSTLVVWLSLVVWGWIWGSLGMFLSVPLTMVVKILLENSDDLKWIAVLMGSGAEMQEREAAAASMRAEVEKEDMPIPPDAMSVEELPDLPEPPEPSPDASAEASLDED